MFDKLFRRLGASKSPSPANQESLHTAVIDYLVKQMSVPDQAVSVMEKVELFYSLSPEKQQDALCGTYLLLEQFLVEVDPLTKWTRQSLRQTIQQDYPAVREVEDLAIVFESERQQEILLCRMLLMSCVNSAYTLMGAALNEMKQWLASVPNHATLPLPLEVQATLPQDEREWVPLLRQLSQSLYVALEMRLGEQVARRIYEGSYQKLNERFQGLETFPVVIGLLPQKSLDEQKISLLSYRQIQRALVENMDELRGMNGVLVAKNLTLEQTQQDLLKAQDEVLASSAQFQAVLNTVGEGIITFDLNGFIVLVNREVQQMWDKDAFKLVGTNISQLVAEVYRTASTKTADSVPMQLGVGMKLQPMLGQRIEIDGMRSDGTLFPLELRITKTEVNETLLYTAAVNDITERKLAEQALQRAYDVALETSEFKSRVLAVVSHDLRSPLSAIMAAAELLIEKSDGDEQIPAIYHKYLERITLSGHQMNLLISDLLQKAQTELGQSKLDLAPFTPARLLASVQEMMNFAAKAKNLTLSGAVEPGVPEMMIGDERRLRQILINLVNNGIKFTDDGSVQIKIFSKDDKTWSISVADTGCGMSVEAQETIFEPFHQVHQSVTQRQKGMGLGLSIVNELVTLMDGDIDVVSQEDVGSTFTVTLPLLLTYNDDSDVLFSE